MSDKLSKRASKGTIITIIIVILMLIPFIRTAPSQWGTHHRILLIFIGVLLIKESVVRGHKMLTIAFKDLKQRLADPKSMVVSVGLPIGMVFILGAAFGGFSKSGNLPSVYLTNLDTGEYGKELVRIIDKYQGVSITKVDEYNPEKVKQLCEKREICGIVVIPENYSELLGTRETAFVQFNFDNSQNISSSIVSGILKGAISEQNSQLVAFDVSMETAQNFDKGRTDRTQYQRYIQSSLDEHAIPKILLQNDAYFKSRGAKGVFNQVLPGMGVMFVLFGAVMGGCVGILRERADWTLIRIRTLPVSKIQLVGGKILGIFLTILVQVLALVIVGVFILKMESTHPLAIIAITALYMFMAVSLGIVISTFVSRMEQIEPVALPMILALAALGGCWFPLEIAPDFLKNVALILPTGIAMHAFTKVLSFGKGIENIVPHLIALGMYGTLFMAFGIKRLNWLE